MKHDDGVPRRERPHDHTPRVSDQALVNIKRLASTKVMIELRWTGNGNRKVKLGVRLSPRNSSLKPLSISGHDTDHELSI